MILPRLTNQTSRIMKKLLKPQTILFKAYLIRSTNKFLNRKILMLFGLVWLSVFNAKAATYYSKSTGYPEVITSWATNIDGTGTSPKDFATNGDVFIIQSGRTMTTNASWTIGDGANVVTLQIDGNLELGKGDALTISSYSVIFFNSTNQIMLSNGKKYFNLNANATLKTINPNGIAGVNCSLPMPAGNFELTLNPAANYECKGVAVQATTGLPPTINNLTISNVSGAVSLANPLTASTITIYPRAGLVHTSGALIVKSLNVLSDATGTGSFVVNGTGTVNTTSISVKQYLAAGRNWYISSPVIGSTTAVLSTAGSVMSYNEPTAAWISESGSTLLPMKGYIAVSPPINGVVTFTGVLNNGPQSISLTRTTGQTKEGFNLVGNPYLSYVDWDLATKTNLETTMWYRTKSTGGVYVFDTYGATAGVGTGLNGIGNVTKRIPPMQAFWVRVVAGKTSGTLAFDNSMRVARDVSTNSFRAPSAIQSIQKVLRLKVSNGTNSDEAIVLFNPNASDELDDFDSPKMTNANPVVPEIYTLSGSERVVINGFNSVDNGREIPLGFTTGESNTFSLKATEINNFDDGTIIILKDNLLETEQELSLTNSYSFISDAFSSSSRFSLIFRTNSITTDLDKGANENSIIINKDKNNQISVSCLSDLNDQSFIAIYNVVGKLLYTKQLVNHQTVLDAPIAGGVCLIRVINGRSCATKKLIFN